MVFILMAGVSFSIFCLERFDRLSLLAMTLD